MRRSLAKMAWPRLWLCAIVATHQANAASHSSPAMKLAALNVDKALVATAGLGNSADFAHQFHVSFSALVRNPAGSPRRSPLPAV